MRKLLVAGAALAASLAAAPAASAAVAAKNAGGDTITFTAGDAEENRISITLSGGDYVFDDTALVVGAGDGCASIGGNAECPSAGVTQIVVLLSDEDDDVTTGALTVPLRIEGGDGWDGFSGSGGDDTLLGGPGVDQVSGGGGVDAVEGGGDMDLLNGGPGVDTIRGGEGGDLLNGEDGNDLLLGEGGDDTFVVEMGSADDFSGGPGVDEVIVPGGGSPSDPPIPVTIDDQSDDYDGGSNVRTDVENVSFGFFLGPFVGAVGVTGSDASNTIRGGAGHDQINGRGGIDFLQSGSGDDRVNSRDGGFDRVICGEGIDIVVVDFADDVQECENVDRAPEPAPVDSDRPPTAAFADLRPGAVLDPNRPIRVAVDATDDRGITQVVLMDGSAIVGTDTAAPYLFDYRPTGDAVGRNTLIAVATDASGQTGTAILPVRIDRFAPASMRLGLRSRARDRRAPYAWRGGGRVAPPPLVSPARGCSGFVTVRLQRGGRTVQTVLVRLRPDCTYTFTLRRRRGRGRFRLVVAFAGNDVLAGVAAPSRAVRAG